MKTVSRIMLLAVLLLVLPVLADETKCNQPSGAIYSYGLLCLEGFYDSNGHFVSLWSELFYGGWIDKCGGHHTTSFGYDCSEAGGPGETCLAWRMIYDDG